MFKLRELESEEEGNDCQHKSKYFSSGSILKTNAGKCDSSDSSATTSSAKTDQQLTGVVASAKCVPQTGDKWAKTSAEPAVKPTLNRRPNVFGNTLLVNPNQTANKLLKHLRIPYHMSDSISPAHYLMYDSCCAIFLSLKYHIIYQNYIYDKLNELRNAYQLKVLLVLVDHIEFQSAIKELTQLAIRTNCTLMLCWSYEEAAHYLENYRQFGDKSADIIMGKFNVNSDSTQTAYQCLTDALTSVKSINKTDALSLISTFDTFDNIVKSDDDQLIICPGMAALKAKRLRQLFHKPFIRSE